VEISLSGTPDAIGNRAQAMACAFCLWQLVDEPPEQIVRCESCSTPYHLDCFQENGGCGTFGCPSWTARQDGAVIPDLIPAFAPSAPVGAFSSSSRPNFCPQCGTPIETTFAFCAGCGWQVTT
jgi:hypothetical protein